MVSRIQMQVPTDICESQQGSNPQLVLVQAPVSDFFLVKDLPPHRKGNSLLAYGSLGSRRPPHLLL